MENCIFCRIAAGEADAYKIYEDKDYVAILDIAPYVEGQTVVIRKKHLDSSIFNNSDAEIKKIMIVSKKVARLLEKAFKPERVCLVFEGKGVPHLHAKLYPVHKTARESDAEYITPMGYHVSKRKLELIYNRILSKNRSNNK